MCKAVDRIKEYRSMLTITQRDLENQLGVAISTVSMYENGERKPSDIVKVKHAEIFGTSVGALFLIKHDTLSKQRRPQ